MYILYSFYMEGNVNCRKKGIWLIIPGLTGFAVFYILPFFLSFYYSTIDNVFDKNFVGLANYAKLMKNSYFMLSLRNTFAFTGLSVPAVMIFSLILSVLLVSFNGKHFKLLRTSFVLPILLPTASIILLANLLFGNRSQYISLLQYLENDVLVSVLYKIPILLLFIWKYTGYNIILLISAITRIPVELYEAANLDGAGFIKRHTYITIPLITPTIFFVGIISTVNSFKIFKEVYLLYGSYPHDPLYLLQHYMNNQFSKLNYHNLTTGAIIFALIIYLLVLLGFKAEHRLTKGVW